jgi:hypothetical protein
MADLGVILVVGGNCGVREVSDCKLAFLPCGQFVLEQLFVPQICGIRDKKK